MEVPEEKQPLLLMRPPPRTQASFRIRCSSSGPTPVSVQNAWTIAGRLEDWNAVPSSDRNPQT